MTFEILTTMPSSRTISFERVSSKRLPLGTARSINVPVDDAARVLKPAAAVTATEADKSGWLLKQARKGSSSRRLSEGSSSARLNKSFFVLRGCELAWFKTDHPGLAEPRCTVDLSSAQVTSVPRVGTTSSIYEFRVTGYSSDAAAKKEKLSSKPLVLRASSAAERNEWVAALQAASQGHEEAPEKKADLDVRSEAVSVEAACVTDASHTHADHFEDAVGEVAAEAAVDPAVEVADEDTAEFGHEELERTADVTCAAEVSEEAPGCDQEQDMEVAGECGEEVAPDVAAPCSAELVVSASPSSVSLALDQGSWLAHVQVHTGGPINHYSAQLVSLSGGSHVVGPWRYRTWKRWYEDLCRRCPDAVAGLRFPSKGTVSDRLRYASGVGQRPDFVRLRRAVLEGFLTELSRRSNEDAAIRQSVRTSFMEEASYCPYEEGIGSPQA